MTMSEEEYPEDPESTGRSEDRLAVRSRARRGLGIFARKATDSLTDTSDPFLEAFGNGLNDLAQEWDEFDDFKSTVADDEELISSFNDFADLIRESKLSSGGKPKLAAADYDAVANLFIEYGKTRSINRVWNISQMEAEKGESAVVAATRIRDENSELGSVIVGIFGFADNEFEELTLQQKDVVNRAQSLFGDLASKSAERYKRIAVKEREIAKTGEKLLKRQGAPAALWMVELVTEAAKNGGHTIQAKKTLADKLVADFQYDQEHSLLGRVLSLVEYQAETGGLFASDFVESLLDENDGDNIHDFYRRAFKLDRQQLAELISSNLDQLPEDIASKYQQYISEQIADMRRTVKSVAASMKSDRTAVNPSQILDVAIRIFKKARGGDPVVKGGVVQSTTGRTSRTAAGVRSKPHTLGRLTDRTQERAPVNRPIRIYTRSAGSRKYELTENTLEHVLSSAIPSSVHKSEVVIERLTRIMDDISQSRLFKAGVQQINRKGGLGVILDNDSSAKKRSVYSINPRKYPGITGPRALNDCRIMFTLGPEGEVAVIGIYATHAGYQRAIANL